MKERPIIFNDEMVRAILDGRKTMTRRTMKVQPESPNFGLSFITESKRKSDEGKYFWSISDACGLKMRSNPFPCPFGAVGDRLWVQETFGDCGVRFVYRADTDDGAACQVKRWTPSIHMPRWASRITLEITGVRVERLQDITEDDARAEGISPAGELLPEYPDAYLTPRGGLSTVRVAFRRLWKSIYGDTGWNSNPWVWVIAFRRIDTGCAAGASKGE